MGSQNPGSTAGDYKLENLISLKNKILKYKRRLLTEAVKICKKRGLEIIVTETKDSSSNPIVIERQGEYVHVENFITLARDKFPNIYRKYIDGKRKYIHDSEHFKISADAC